MSPLWRAWRSLEEAAWWCCQHPSNRWYRTRLRAWDGIVRTDRYGQLQDDEPR